MRALTLTMLSLPVWIMTALAQANPTANEPTLGGRLGGWLAFFIVAVVAVLIYRNRRRAAASYDPAAPTGTRLDPEH